MRIKLKPLRDQTIVITGASSGIGLSTARRAAASGARLVLAARDGDSLRRLVDEVKKGGGRAIAVTADVANLQEVERIAQEAQKAFGGFDTWVNNAGVSIYGRLAEISIEDHRRLFDTNFWGVVHGSLVAAAYLRPAGGAIINVGSTTSDRAIPLQGMYSASKHAVKGFTDALRMELEEEGAPISVTLIKPGAIDTPYVEHAKNYLNTEPTNPPPLYAPDVVAEAILHCAAKPERDVMVGAGGKFISMAGKYAPRLTDLLMEKMLFRMQHSDRRRDPERDDGLYTPRGGLRERGGYEGHVAESSAYTQASLHPVVTGALLLGTGLVVRSLLAGNNKSAKQALARGRPLSRIRGEVERGISH